MGVSGCALVTKWLLVFFNAIFFLLGIGILGVGIWLKVERADYEEISAFDYVTPSNIAIAVGVIVLVVSFLGCFGAAVENNHMLLVHFILLLLIFILQIVACILAYVNRGKVEDELAEDFKKSIKEKYWKPGENATTDVIDKFQDEFECCGFDGYKDWLFSYYNNVTGSIPQSCCIESKKNTPKCGSKDPADIDVYEKKGCFNEVRDFLKENLLLVGGFALGMAIIQIIGLVLTMYLYIAVSRDKKGILA